VNAIQSLEGGALLAVICILLFLEECGLPLPFAPGDLLLAVGGIAIAGGRINPAVFVAAAAASTLAGAALGREIFARVGFERLMRVAGRLHARKPLQRASEILRRSGWRGVFTARLIPGLRVHTTQVAGVTRMSRGSFYAGLLPATAVYLAAFVGLGAAFGRPILGLIHRAEHQALIAVAVVALALVAFLGARVVLRRTLVSLEEGGWTGALRFQLESAGIVLIPACIGLNFAGHTLAKALSLPLFLDSIGTILCGVLAGPWIGGSVGFISNLVSSNTIDPTAAPYGVVSFAVGFAAGLGRYLHWQKRLSGWITLWAVCFAISSLLSTPINVLFYGGLSGVPPADSLFSYLRTLRLPLFSAAFLSEVAIDLPDKLVTVVAALLIAQGLPAPREGAERVNIDIADAFTYVFRSRRWRRKILAGAACLLFFWLVIPFLLFSGYAVAVARNVRRGVKELPRWDDLWSKVIDGFLILVLFLIWNLPGILLAIPAGLASADPGQTAAIPNNPAYPVLAGIGSLWGVLALVLQAAIWSQYIARGFWSALNMSAILRRLRFNLGLTIVVGALTVALSVAGLVGVALLVVGLLVTLPYSSWIGAYLVGRYAQITDAALAY
jgi:energy-coupling factor transport system substrate-specific component